MFSIQDIWFLTNKADWVKNQGWKTKPVLEHEIIITRNTDKLVLEQIFRCACGHKSRTNLFLKNHKTFHMCFYMLKYVYFCIMADRLNAGKFHQNFQQFIINLNSIQENLALQTDGVNYRPSLLYILI